MRKLTLLFFLMNVALFAMNAYFIGTRGYVAGGSFDSTSLVTIALTSVAVLVTALGIFIAVLAIWGYNSLKQGAIDEAVKRAVDAAEAQAARTSERRMAVIPSKAAGNETEPQDYGSAAGAGREAVDGSD
ncbi:hypothetical protein [Roseibium sp.]|uniref:hypothetical protein n=1 Tax=Roseibium sp. TaxID=1936156 RepID=UPI00328D8EC3